MSDLKFYPFCPECRYVFKAELCDKHERKGIDTEIISGLTGERSDGDY